MGHNNKYIVLTCEKSIIGMAIKKYFLHMHSRDSHHSHSMLAFQRESEGFLTREKKKEGYFSEKTAEDST